MITLEKTKALENRSISIQIRGKVFANTAVFREYMEENELERVCKDGCPNYGKKWSCPPFSKSFAQIEEKYISAFLLCLSTEMDNYTDIKNKYLAVKAANVTLKSMIEKCAREIEKYTNGYSLLSGSCRLCKPCQCKINRPCKHPDKMRYSMEATGLNVQKICHDFLNHRLLWYENKILPEYTSVVVLILFNGKVSEKELSEIVCKTIEGS